MTVFCCDYKTNRRCMASVFFKFSYHVAPIKHDFAIPKNTEQRDLNLRRNQFYKMVEFIWKAIFKNWNQLFVKIYKISVWVNKNYAFLTENICMQSEKWCLERIISMYVSPQEMEGLCGWKRKTFFDILAVIFLDGSYFPIFLFYFHMFILSNSSVGLSSFISKVCTLLMVDKRLISICCCPQSTCTFQNNMPINLHTPKKLFVKKFKLATEFFDRRSLCICEFTCEWHSTVIYRSPSKWHMSSCVHN